MNYRSMSEKESRLFSPIFKNFHGKDLDDPGVFYMFYHRCFRISINRNNLLDSEFLLKIYGVHTYDHRLLFSLWNLWE